MLTPMRTRKEAAIRLGIDPDGVSSLVATKQLRAVNVSKKPNAKRPTWMFRDEDLTEFELVRSTGGAPKTHNRPRRPTTRKSYF